MENIIGVKELRQNLKKYERLVKSGRSFVVMKRSKPVFRIGPVVEEGWETVVDFTKFRRTGISADELLTRLKAM